MNEYKPLTIPQIVVEYYLKAMSIKVVSLSTESIRDGP